MVENMILVYCLLFNTVEKQIVSSYYYPVTKTVREGLKTKLARSIFTFQM